MGGLKKVPPEGGSGGGRGHSNMEHWASTQEVKDAARVQRRAADRLAVDQGSAEQHAGGLTPRYEAIEPQNLAEAESTASTGSLEELQRAIIAVSLHEPNFGLALAFCRRFAEHHDPGVRGNAVLALGHLARIHRNAQLAADLPIVRRALADPDGYVRGQAEAAAGDFETFLKLRAR